MSLARRPVLTSCLALLSAPASLRAQLSQQRDLRLWHIGIVGNVAPSAAEVDGPWLPFDDAMHQLGLERLKHYRLDWRFAAGDPAQYPPMTAALLANGANLLLALGDLAASAARDATSTVPVVMAMVSDPVGLGLARSLAHPGGNLTGIADQSDELDVKRLELLQELRSAPSRLGVLYDPAHALDLASLSALQSTAQLLGFTLLPVPMRRSTGLPEITKALRRAKPAAMLVFDQPVNLASQAQIIDMVQRLRIVTVYQSQRWVRMGGLLSYAASPHEQLQRAAAFVARIMRGARPADLPIEQPTKFKLVINLKAARSMDLRIPQSMLARADEVIE